MVYKDLYELCFFLTGHDVIIPQPIRESYKNELLLLKKFLVDNIENKDHSNAPAFLCVDWTLQSVYFALPSGEIVILQSPIPINVAQCHECITKLQQSRMDIADAIIAHEEPSQVVAFVHFASQPDNKIYDDLGKMRFITSFIERRDKSADQFQSLAASDSRFKSDLNDITSKFSVVRSGTIEMVDVTQNLIKFKDWEGKLLTLDSSHVMLTAAKDNKNSGLKIMTNNPLSCVEIGAEKGASFDVRFLPGATDSIEGDEIFKALKIHMKNAPPLVH